MLHHNRLADATIRSPRCFFFASRRRHPICGRDWSSDVCSSDLSGARRQPRGRRARRAVVKLRVPISEHRDASYDIQIGRGLLAELPELVRAACPAARYAVITDSHIGKLYGEQVVARLHDGSYSFPIWESVI